VRCDPYMGNQKSSILRISEDVRVDENIKLMWRHKSRRYGLKSCSHNDTISFIQSWIFRLKQ